MQDEIEHIRRRLSELSGRAFSRGVYTASEFLTLAEQDALLKMRREDIPAPYTLYGGFPGAERRLAQFGDAALCGYDREPPILCVRCRPAAPKFADTLAHRDFLGALLSLGVRRGVLGDIMLQENIGYIACLDSVAEFIAGGLTRVRSTAMVCDVLEEIPEIAALLPEAELVNVASERADAVVAAVYRLSRGESAALFTQGRVYIDGALCGHMERALPDGAVVSVRGCGRFIYRGAVRETRKGRLYVSVQIFR